MDHNWLFIGYAELAPGNDWQFAIENAPWWWLSNLLDNNVFLVGYTDLPSGNDWQWAFENGP